MKDFYHHYRIVRIFIKILIPLILLLLFVFLFLKLWLPFGGSPSKKDKKDYEARASNYKDGRFWPYEEFTMISKTKEKNTYLSTKNTKPKESLPTVGPTPLSTPHTEDLTVSWLGHSTIFLQMQGMNILIDPVFSDRTSPVSWIGPKRYTKMPIEIEDLPDIDIVLITHDHYDHLDYQTIRELDGKVKRYVVPLGIENHLERWHVDASKITNMAWWEEIEINGLTIGCTPAKHYSGRGLTDRYQTLWASWVLKNDEYQIYDSGDSGFGNHFADIASKYGPFDLVLMDSGQYNVQWHDVHMNPKESVDASKILQAKVAMPIHYGSFVLADHPWDDPVEAFTTYAKQNDLEVVTPRIGETFELSNYQDYQEEWWKSIS